MASNYPTSLDNFTNPTGSSALTSPDHAGQHSDLNDAVEQLQAKVGVNNSAVTTSLDYKVATNTPTGCIMLYSGSTAPSGWLLCDGSAILRSGYTALFALVGTTYGPGNGVSTFNLPNLKGRVPVGRDAAQTEFDALGENGGAKTHTLSTSEMPSHTHVQNAHNHGITDPGHAHAYGFWFGTAGGSVGATLTGVTQVSSQTNNQTTGISINNQTATNQNTGGGGAHNNLQPYLVLNYIIKT